MDGPLKERSISNAKKKKLNYFKIYAGESFEDFAQFCQKNVHLQNVF